MLKPKVLVITGEGINCEKETAFAFKEAGGDVSIQSLNTLINDPQSLFDYQILALPGGFSYGDEIGSGQVLALKLKKYLGKELKDFVSRKRPIIGICNGFQILSKMDFFSFDGERKMALAPNESGHFINKWSALSLNPKSKCIWTKNIKEKGTLPVRHGEGRLILKEGEEKEILKRLESGNQIVLTYDENFNGSAGSIAGICDPSGLVFGLMPHPEADLYKATHPTDKADPLAKSWGYEFFKNAIDYIQEGSWS